MGEAADDAWDDAFERQTDLSLMLSRIKKGCEQQCDFCNSEQDLEDANWLPYRCVTCGRRIDFP